MPFRLLLATSRSFHDYDLLKSTCDKLLVNKPDIELVFATEKGSAGFISKYGKERNHKAKVFVVDWFGDGKEGTIIQYEKMVEYGEAAIVFWDGVSYNEKRLISLAENNMRCVVKRFETIKQQIERAEKEEPKKVKRKKVTVPLMPKSRQRYLDAHKKWHSKQYPTANKDGLYSPPKMFPINGGAAMDKFIINFVVWDGWSATKVAVMLKRGEEFIRTGAKDGTFDVHCTIKSRSVKIDTKHSKDTASKAQIKMQERERNAGAIAEFLGSIEEFFILYDKILKDENKSNF